MQVAVDGSCPILATVAEVLMQQRPYMLIRGVGDVEGGGGEGGRSRDGFVQSTAELENSTAVAYFPSSTSVR